MAAPNIVNVTTITGKTAVQAITSSNTAIVTNSSGSNKVFKVNSLYVSNIDGENNAEVTIDLFRANTAYFIARTIVVPADATLDVINKSIYLEEDDNLRILGSANSALHAVCSYEEIS